MTQTEPDPQTVLLVEDDDLVANVVRIALETLGYTVIHASNGQAGLQAFREAEDSIKLILTDVQMPIMDGMAMIRELRATGAKVPVIAMSGFPARERKRLGVEPEGLIWIEKPPELNQLAEVLREAIDQGS